MISGEPKAKGKCEVKMRGAEGCCERDSGKREV